MELKDIKKGFFGFNKSSVFEYISELNRVCAEKVAEAKKEKSSSLTALNAKNEELNNKVMCFESELDTLKKQLAEKDALISQLTAQNDELKNSTDTRKLVEAEVSEILTEARRFALALREKAIRENEDFRLENRKLNEAERQRLEKYGDDISEIKAAINSVLSETIISLESVEDKIAAL